MTDPAATLRALADACKECDRFDRVIRGRSGCDSAQRDALMCALPRGGWPETADTLRTQADAIDRLTRERDEARALLTAAVPGLERDAARSGNGEVLTRVRAWLGVSDG